MKFLFSKGLRSNFMKRLGYSRITVTHIYFCKFPHMKYKSKKNLLAKNSDLPNHRSHLGLLILIISK